MRRGLTFLFAVAAGAAVGNLYWAQPLFEIIAQDLGVATATAGFLVTATQVGYAVGILLLVPLGDVLDRRRMIPVLMSCAAVALVACALAPSFAFWRAPSSRSGSRRSRGSCWHRSPPTWPTRLSVGASSGSWRPASSPGSSSRA